jgi:predicted RNase H-like nuclease (RuvC/YqgF family)
MVEFHNHEQLSRLESTLTKCIAGINNLQKENTQEILLAIGNLSTTLNQISTNKGKDTTKIQEVLALKEKIQILESQLKIKEHQALLEKSQLEESVKRTQSILDLTREQFLQPHRPYLMHLLVKM